MMGFKLIVHMDDDYYWRVYICDDKGNILAVSLRRFFKLVDATREWQRWIGIVGPANDN